MTRSQALTGHRAGRRRALESIRSIDHRFAINQLDDGFFDLDRDWRVRFANVAGARMVGRRVDDLLGKDIWAGSSSAVESLFHGAYLEALETQQRVEFVEYFNSLNAWLSIQVFPSPDGVTLVLRDVSQIHGLIAERRALIDRLLEAEDRERARIAADVHDDSVQALGVVSLQLQLLRHHLASSSPVVEGLLEGLSEQVTGATNRLRALLFSLEPTNASAPISEGIRIQAAHIFDGCSMHWSVDDIDVGEELPQSERSQALRITKEALTNARAHSQASEVIVTLRGDEDGLEIEIADNGVAVDPTTFTSAAGHRGLATMRDRAAAVGGGCSLEPSSPTGCTVRIYIPHVRPSHFDLGISDNPDALESGGAQVGQALSFRHAPRVGELMFGGPS